MKRQKLEQKVMQAQQVVEQLAQREAAAEKGLRITREQLATARGRLEVFVEMLRSGDFTVDIPKDEPDETPETLSADELPVEPEEEGGA